MALHGDLEAELAQLRGGPGAVPPRQLAVLFECVARARAPADSRLASLGHAEALAERLLVAAVAATPGEWLQLYTMWVFALGKAAPAGAGRRIAAVQQRLLSDPRADPPNAWHYGLLIQAYCEAREYEALFSEAYGMLEPPRSLKWSPTIVAILIKTHGELRELDQARAVEQRSIADGLPLSGYSLNCLLVALGRNGALAEMFAAVERHSGPLSSGNLAILRDQVQKAADASGGAAAFLLEQYAAMPTALGRRVVASGWARTVIEPQALGPAALMAVAGPLQHRGDFLAGAVPALRRAGRHDLAAALARTAHDPQAAA